MMGSEIGHWAGRWQAEVSAELDRLGRQVRAGRPVGPDYVACLGALEHYLGGVQHLCRRLAVMEDEAIASSSKGGV